MATSTPPGPAVETVIRPFGDAALMIDLVGGTEHDRRMLATRIRRALLVELPVGVTDIVAGFESILVEFDPDEVTHESVEQAARLGIAVNSSPSEVDSTARTIAVPTLFGGEYGPDLELVAAELGIPAQEVVARFTAAPIPISLLGAAMAPMMYGVDFPSEVSRTPVPRSRVEGGSVMVAGLAAIISPFPGPTGWKVIGRTPRTVCDITLDPSIAFAPGDSLHFHPVDEAEYLAQQGVLLDGSTVSR